MPETISDEVWWGCLRDPVGDATICDLNILTPTPMPTPIPSDHRHHTIIITNPNVMTFHQGISCNKKSSTSCTPDTKMIFSPRDAQRTGKIFHHQEDMGVHQPQMIHMAGFHLPLVVLVLLIGFLGSKITLRPLQPQRPEQRFMEEALLQQEEAMLCLESWVEHPLREELQLEVTPELVKEYLVFWSYTAPWTLETHRVQGHIMTYMDPWMEGRHACQISFQRARIVCVKQTFDRMKRGRSPAEKELWPTFIGEENYLQHLQSTDSTTTDLGMILEGHRNLHRWCNNSLKRSNNSHSSNNNMIRTLLRIPCMMWNDGVRHHHVLLGQEWQPPLQPQMVHTTSTWPIWHITVAHQHRVITLILQCTLVLQPLAGTQLATANLIPVVTEWYPIRGVWEVVIMWVIRLPHILYTKPVTLCLLSVILLRQKEAKLGIQQPSPNRKRPSGK